MPGWLTYQNLFHLKSHRHLKPSQKAISIWEKVHSSQLEASTAIARAKSRLMVALIAQLEPLLEEIKAYDREIQRLFRMHSDSRIFTSIPGAGVRLAPRLLAEWGDDRDRYIRASVVQALADTSLVLHQSGKYRYARQRRSCIKQFRRAMHLLAFQAIRWISWARYYYELKRSQGKAHHEALRALANILTRIIFAMWRNNTTYNESIFLLRGQAMIKLHKIFLI